MRATRGILSSPAGAPVPPPAAGRFPRITTGSSTPTSCGRHVACLRLAALDAAPFDPAIHLQPIHALPLAWLSGMLDAERAALDHGIAAVVGNGIGFVAALTATGVIGFDDGFAYVQELGRLQQGPLPAAATAARSSIPAPTRRGARTRRWPRAWQRP